MNGVSEWIENGGDIQIHGFFVSPDVGHRNRDVVGKCARPVHTDSLGVCAQVPPPRQAVAAASTHHVPLASHDVAAVKVVHIRAGLDNFADKLMADHHGHRYGPL